MTAAPVVAEARPRHAFASLLLRDLVVLRKNLREFVPRTVLQPLMLVFVFTYVMPKVGLGIGGTSPSGGATSAFATLLVAGVVATTILFQGIQSTALPLVQEFGYTREIEDRVLAPLPVAMVALAKIVSGALQCLLAGLLVFPIAAIVPEGEVRLDIDWPVLVTLLPLACLMAGSLGLFFGTIFDPRTLPVLFGVIVVPLTFLGCVYYPWTALESIRWLQILVLVNPLVYLSEGFRAALTPADHMSLLAVYPVLLGFTGVLGWRALTQFRGRVLT